MAIWVPDLSGRRGPKYLQIVEALANDVASGRLPVGARLPPHRELAYRLELSPHTTSRAYAEGVRRALLRGEVGRGTFVRAIDADVRGGPAADLRRPSTGPVDLSRNLPLAGPAEPYLRQALSEIGRSTDLRALLDYQTADDPSRQAQAWVQWLRLCAVDAEADEIVVTNGAQHGLFCSLMALLRPGDLLLTEALTYAPVLAMAERLGLQTGAVATDEHGLDPESLESICCGSAPRALYLIPTLQAPTTATLSTTRRRAIAEIARRQDLMLIEDDVFGLLKPDRPPPIAALAPERTIYVTSVSKCIAPGLRVGFLRAPRDLAPALHRALSLSAWMTPPLTSEIVAHLIVDGAAQQLIAAQRSLARRRQRLARSVLDGLDVAADPDGLHIWLWLPNGWKADVFRSVAEERGVLVAEARRFAANPGASPEAVRICLTHEVDEARLQHGLRQIARLLDLPPIGADTII